MFSKTFKNIVPLLSIHFTTNPSLLQDLSLLFQTLAGYKKTGRDIFFSGSVF